RAGGRMVPVRPSLRTHGAVHAVRVRRHRGAGRAHTRGLPRRRDRPGANGRTRCASSLSRPPGGIREANRCADPGEHLVQHPGRTHRLHAARRRRVLLDLAARRPRDRLVPAREGAFMSRPRISVVVPTFRRPELLRRCLVALCTQDLDPGDYEIVVADDGPSPETARAVADLDGLPGSPRVRCLPVGHTQGPAGARNVGWRAATAPLIAFTDDDTIPDPGWLPTGLEALDSGADAAVGRTIVPAPQPPTDYERGVAGLERAEFITANCFVSRRALERVGGFDERYERAWREDSDLQFALMDHGFVIASAPAAIVVHPIRPAPWGVSLSQQRQVMYDALRYRKYPGHYRRRIRAAPPIDYYVAVIAFAAGV